MSHVQINNEISERLENLRNATTAAIGFNRTDQLRFEGNRQFTSLARYQRAIQTMGRLMARHQTTLESDIRNCEQLSQTKEK